MKHTIDVTNDYGDIDFEMCTIFFPVPRKLGARVEVESWGLIIRPSNTARYSDMIGNLSFDLTKMDAFIAGYSIFAIDNPVEGELWVALYDVKGRDITFRCDRSGKRIQLAQSWKDETTYEDACEYNLGGTLCWPFGYCSLDLFARGAATITFELDDCVPIDAVIENPSAYLPPERSRTKK